ncbi:MAG: excinuclease ABC subunit UvrC [Methanobrevibacter sp.]|jgi:excinuclease ABC subunit C|nr:excinuclease ABC subunit UvrC [Candidatus Methanovirga meridionalis]
MSTKVKSANDLPEKPGIYIMKDKKDKIIYIGKSKSLKKRVKSYFKDKHESPKTYVLMKHFYSLEYIITESEKEALILEANLIKKHRPRYNIRLKDDKRYPYVKIVNEKYPRLNITRNITKGGIYYGPFTDVGSVRKTVKFLKSLFKIRTCKNMDGPCLNSQIDLCHAPCDNGISQEEYKKIIEKVDLFFDGKYNRIIEDLEKEMEEIAIKQEYEKAAVLRDQINSIKEVMEKQFVVFENELEQDIIAFSNDKDRAIMVVLSVRNGKIIGKDDFLMAGTENQDSKDILSAFIQQFYGPLRTVPKEIIVEEEISDKEVILEYLSDLRFNERNSLNNNIKTKLSNKEISLNNKNNLENTEDMEKEKNKSEIDDDSKVKIVVAENGIELRLLRMAAKNADIIRKQKRKMRNSMIELKKYLKLEKLPRIIEGYDVSNISGVLATGSKVSFLDSKPNKKEYKKFKLKTPGPDDYGMMREILQRRFKAFANHNKNSEDGLKEPDLILIDGGKGQLNIGVEVLKEYGLEHIPIIGLAKEFEEVFIPQSNFPIIIPKNNQGLQLLQRVRDEAHRFAVSYHRHLRSKNLEYSVLDDIQGIGKRRKINLLKEFGDIEAIKKASINSLSNVKGMNKKSAINVYNFFHK